jgi:hypothetical protein
METSNHSSSAVSCTHGLYGFRPLEQEPSCHVDPGRQRLHVLCWHHGVKPRSVLQ